MKKISIRDGLQYFAPAIALTLVGFVVAYQFVAPAPPRQITIATGQSAGTYYDIGMEYKAILGKDRVTLNIKETSGSIENLGFLTDKSSDVDIIFMQGGVNDNSDATDLVSLGSIYYEPLWVFHRADLPIRQLSDIRGMRISVGLEGSGTRELSLQLLALNGVTEENSRILNLPIQASAEQLLAGLIDVAFFVIGYRNKSGRSLINSPEVKLLNFRRGEAYTRNLHFLSLVKLPEGALDFVNNIPGEDVYLLAPTAQLVTRKGFHPALIDLLLQAAGEVSDRGGIFEKPLDFPTPRFITFPLSSEAKRFYESGTPFLRRYLPFWLANFLNRMKIMMLPLLALFFPLIRLLPPFYRWRVRSRIYRWYDLLEEIDYEMLSMDISERKNEFNSRLNWIEKKVSQISVPRGYSRELYDMRIHIEMLRKKLRDREVETYGPQPEGQGDEAGDI